MIRILHVCEYTKGGIATYLSELLAYQQAAAEISNVCVVLSDYKVSKNQFEGIGAHYYHYSRKPKYFLKAALKINQVIQKEKPDIIHVHSTFAGVFSRLLLFLKRKRPLVVYCSHGWAFAMDIPHWKKRLYAMVERLLALKTDLIINISNSEWNTSLRYKLPPQKSIVIHNGLKLQDASLHPELTEVQLDSSKINLLFVGRFDKQKGLDLLIEFFKNMRFGHIRLYLIGDSVLDSDPLKLPSNITSIGWVDHHQMDGYYRKFDAVIIPSRWEGFGLVALEAMRNKKPVIVSNRGALPEIVNDGVNGFVFQLGDDESLKNILLKLRKSDLEVMGHKGYEIYLNKFTSDHMNEKIIQQYKMLMEKGRQ